MLHYLFKIYLKHIGKEHISSFMDGLAYLGKPSQVFFPTELVDQGLSLILSGLNNTMAIQSNPNWIWPYWWERQSQPKNAEFLPTGVSIVTMNLTRRNWTSLGCPISSRESMIDPVGMLTPWAYGPSMFPYIKWQNNLYDPPHLKASQTLSEQAPKVITDYESFDALSWRSEASALVVNGHELVDFTHHLTNISADPITLTFGIAIRPYNSLMIGHINELKYKHKQRLWQINRCSGLLLDSDPDRVFLSDRHGGDPLVTSHRSGDELKSRSGIMAGVCEYDITLKPMEERTIESYAMIGKHSHHTHRRHHKINLANIDKARENFAQYFAQNIGDGLTITIPDKRLEKAFYALKNHIHVFDDGKYFSPGTFLYHDHWIRDSAFMMLSYENLSWQDRLTQKVFGLLESQERSGFFRSQNGEWDSNGEAIFTIINHIRHSGDVALARTVYPRLLKGARWIICMFEANNRKEHIALLPAGISTEHFGPNDHYYWDNFWSLAAIEELLWLGKKLHKQQGWLDSFCILYRLKLLASLQRTSMKVGGRRLPCSPSRMMDCAAIGNLVAISPLNLFDPDDYWAQPTVEYLWQHHVVDDLFFQKIIHTGLNAYLSAQLARVFLVMGDERFHKMLDALFNMGSPTLTWPEAIHPSTGGGCMGDGDHGWACAEVINLIREMFVHEAADELTLGLGISPLWTSFAITNASSRYGKVSYSLEDGSFKWQITRHDFHETVPVYLAIKNRAKTRLFGDQGIIKI